MFQVQAHVNIITTIDESLSTFNKSGSVFFSKFRNKSACKFGRQEKLKIENRRVPGPGTYDTSRIQFSPEGKYFFSRLQSAKSNKFGKSNRLTTSNRCQSTYFFIVSSRAGQLSIAELVWPLSQQECFARIQRKHFPLIMIIMMINKPLIIF